MLKFELKKLYKNKLIFLTIILAIILALYNFFNIKSKLKISDMDNTYVNIRYIYFKQSDLKDKVAKDDKKLAARMEDYLNKISNIQNQEYEDSKSYLENNIKLANLYKDCFSDIKEANVTNQELDSIKWTEIEASHYLNNKINYDNNPFTINSDKIIRLGINDFFSFIPLVFFALMGAFSLSKEYEGGTIISSFTSPQSRSQILLAKFLSLFTLVFIYILTIIVANVIILKINAYNFESLSYIKRILGYGFSYINTYQIFARSILLFVVFAFFTITFSLLLASFTKNTSATILGITMLFIGSYLLYKSNLLENFNLFSLLDYNKSLLGSISYGNFLRIGFDYPTIVYALNKKYHILYILFGLICILSSLALINGEYILKSEKTKPIKNFNLNKFTQAKVLMSSPKTFILISITTLLILPTFGLYINDKNIKFNMENNNPELKDIKIQIDNIKENPTISTGYDLSEAEETAKYLEEEVMYYKSRESGKFYDIQLKLQNSFLRLGGFIREGANKFKDGLMSKIGEKISKDRLKLLKEKNINPIYNTGVFVSSYDRFSDSSQKSYYLMNQTPTNSSGLYSIFRVNEIYKFNYLILGFLVLFFFKSWTYEKEKANNLYLIFTKPVKRQKYHLLIIKNQIKNIGAFLLFFYLLFLLISSIVGGIGDYNFPIVKYLSLSPDKYSSIIKQENYYTFMNLSTYIIKYLSLLFLGAVFLASLSNIISIFVKTGLRLYISLIAILAFGFLLINILNIPILKALLPFAYLDAHNLASNATIIIYENSKMTYFMGSLVLIIWSIILNLFCIGKLDIE